LTIYIAFVGILLSMNVRFL